MIFLDLWLVLAAVAAWSFAVSGVAVTRRTAVAAARLAMHGVVALLSGMGSLLRRAGADGYFTGGTRHLGRLAPVARGALIAVPVVVGFTLLLVSADAVFGRAVDEMLSLPLDLGDLTGRGAFAAVAAFLVAGPVAIASGIAWRGGVEWLVRELGPDGPAGPLAPADRRTDAVQPHATDASDVASTGAASRRGGTTETLVVLGAVDALFAGFAVVQVMYLFGGADTLAAIGMTYSDYARQGYFQLVGVVALAGLLLLGAHQVVGRTRPFLVAALALMVLTAVILGSAALRLRLYQEAYGWTELRFFVAASIAWLAACVVLAATCLAADRMRWLPHGLAMSAVAVTLAVSVLGPQAFVMRENLARALDPSLVPPGGRSGLDADYALSLGTDAIPDLVAALDRLPPGQRQLFLGELRFRALVLEGDAGSKGPLAWNLARERAREALRSLPPE